MKAFSAHEPSPAVSASQQSRSVLVVDPNHIENSDLSWMLLRYGLVGSVARDAESALRLSTAMRFDYAIVELKLPGISGLDLVADLSKSQPDCRILVSSDHCDVRTAFEVTKLGAVDVLPKSCPSGMLIGTMLGLSIENFSENNWLTTPKLVKRSCIAAAYASANCNVGRAARKLSMDRRSLLRYLKSNGIMAETRSSPPSQGRPVIVL